MPYVKCADGKQRWLSEEFAHEADDFAASFASKNKEVEPKAGKEPMSDDEQSEAEEVAKEEDDTEEEEPVVVVVSSKKRRTDDPRGRDFYVEVAKQYFHPLVPKADTAPQARDMLLDIQFHTSIAASEAWWDEFFPRFIQHRGDKVKMMYTKNNFDYAAIWFINLLKLLMMRSFVKSGLPKEEKVKELEFLASIPSIWIKKNGNDHNNWFICDVCVHGSSVDDIGKWRSVPKSEVSARIKSIIRKIKEVSGVRAKDAKVNIEEGETLDPMTMKKIFLFDLFKKLASSDKRRHMNEFIGFLEDAGVPENTEDFMTKFNAQPHLLAVGNGVVDLKKPTFEILPYRPSHLITYRTAIKLPPIKDEYVRQTLGADSKAYKKFKQRGTLPGSFMEEFMEKNEFVFHRFFTQIMETTKGVPDRQTMKYLKVLFGLFCTGEGVKKAFQIIGETNCAKSEIEKVLDRTLGGERNGYLISIPPKAFLSSSSSNEHDTNLASTKNKRLAVVNETSNNIPFDPSKVLSLTGGGDRVGFRDLYQSASDSNFRAKCKFLFISNYGIKMAENHNVAVLRWQTLRFCQQFVDPEEDIYNEEIHYPVDKHLEEKLMVEDPWILWWIISGAYEYYEAGQKGIDKFITDRVKEDTYEYRQELDPIYRFFDACVITKEAGIVRAEETALEEYEQEFGHPCTDEAVVDRIKKVAKEAFINLPEFSEENKKNRLSKNFYQVYKDWMATEHNSKVLGEAHFSRKFKSSYSKYYCQKTNVKNDAGHSSKYQTIRPYRDIIVAGTEKMDGYFTRKMLNLDREFDSIKRTSVVHN